MTTTSGSSSLSSCCSSCGFACSASSSAVSDSVPSSSYSSVSSSSSYLAFPRILAFLTISLRNFSAALTSLRFSYSTSLLSLVKVAGDLRISLIVSFTLCMMVARRGFLRVDNFGRCKFCVNSTTLSSCFLRTMSFRNICRRTRIPATACPIKLFQAIAA